jgi:photosystem II stability/assembly factor-like uncharacterized protein
MKRYLFAIGVLLVGSLARADEHYVWKNVAIYGGGFVTGIITHPKQAGLMYCRTDIGGAYRWDANAKQWIPLNDWVSSREGNLLGIESLAIDPSDPTRVYMTAGTYNESKDVTSILRSTDQGRTFQRSDINLRMGGNDGGRPVGERLAVDPNDGKVLFFGSRAAGLWVSTDGAANWKKVESFPAIATDKSTRMTAGGWSWPVGISFVQFDGTSGTAGKPTPVIYVGVCTRETNLYRSTDGGKTWTAVAGQPIGLRPNHVALSRDGWMYISYADEPGPHEMNDGAIWKMSVKSGEWVNVTPVKPGEGDKFGYSGISIDGSDPNVLVACTMCRWTKKDQVFRSTDAGKTWNGLLHTEPDSQPLAVYDHTAAPYTKQSTPHWLGDVEIDPFDSNRVLFVTGYGIWASTDAATAGAGKHTHWMFEDKGLEEIACLDLLSPPSGAHLISIIGDQDGFRHDDLNVPSPLGRHSPTMGSDTSGDFAELRPELMARVGSGKPFGCWSSDGGSTWQAFTTTPRDARGGTIAISADGSAIVWASERGDKPHVSADRGATWNACSGLPAGAIVVADRVDPNSFFATARGDKTLYASHDGGKSFATRSSNLPDADKHRLRALPGVAGDLWLCADWNGLYHSADGGVRFTKISNLALALAVGFGKAAPGKSYPAIYVVGKVKDVDGVYRSDDQGATWVRINDDQHQYAWIGQCIIGDPRIYGRVYLATNGRGVIYGDPANSKEATSR